MPSRDVTRNVGTEVGTREPPERVSFRGFRASERRNAG